jgi:hypothetical protein
MSDIEVMLKVKFLTLDNLFFMPSQLIAMNLGIDFDETQYSILTKLFTFFSPVFLV